MTCNQRLRWLYDRFYGIKRCIFTLPHMILGYIVYYIEYKTRNVFVITAKKEVMSDINFSNSVNVLVDLMSMSKTPSFQDISTQLFSIPQIQSFGFYWNRKNLEEDIKIFGKPMNNLEYNSKINVEPALESFYTANSLLKNHARGRFTYLIDEHFLNRINLSQIDEKKILLLVNDKEKENCEQGLFLSLSASGCSLHERLALAKLCDGYLGENKLLCAIASKVLSSEEIFYE